MSLLRYFFLDEKNLYRTKNKLKDNPRIIKFNSGDFWAKGMPTPSPSFASIEELAQKDQRFKAFRKARPSTAVLLTKQENIIDMRDLILTSSKDHSQAGRMLLHLLEGKREAKQFSGIHFLPNPLPFYVTNFTVVDLPDKNGVYTATFQIQEENGKILSKENISTLFPQTWSRQRVYDECLYALETIQQVEGKRSYQSKTLCGIPVEIHFDEKGEKIRTLYPIRIS